MASFPCTPALGAPAAEEFSVTLDFLTRALAALVELSGFPDLKFVAKTDKSDCTLEPSMGAQALRKDDASVPIDREDLDVAIERDRQLVPLIRIVRQACEKPVDLLRQSLATSIECRRSSRSMKCARYEAESTLTSIYMLPSPSTSR